MVARTPGDPTPVHQYLEAGIVPVRPIAHQVARELVGRAGGLKVFEELLEAPP